MSIFKKEVIYASITTSEPFSTHKAIEQWIYNSIVYQNIMKYCKTTFFADDFEKDLSRSAFDPNATIYIDILSGHSAKRRVGPTRPKLEKLIECGDISALHVYDFSLLGDSISEILYVYKRCADNNIAITCINYSLPNESEPFSSGIFNYGFNPDMYQQAIEYIKNSDITNSRGHIQKDLTYNFIHALMLYEAYMISEATAIALSGLSPNTFHTKSYEIETHPKDYALDFNLFDRTYSTYEEILTAWMSFASSSPEINFSSNDYIDSPKRYGSIPMTPLESTQYEEAKKEAAESKKLFKKGLVSSVIKMPEQNGFCNTFRFLDDDSFEELSKEELYQKLMELRLPIITPIDFKRYRKKLQLMDTKKRYRVNTDNSPMEIAVTDYLNNISLEKRNTIDFITWLSNN